MAYSDFKKLKQVVERFNLKVERKDLFDLSEIKPIVPSDWLKRSLKIAEDAGFSSEKERSERLIAPILSEILSINDFKITLYSGHELNVDKAVGLTGECDYLMSFGKKVNDYVQAPIFSVVEAKKQDMEHGTAQSVAQMIGAKRYNSLDSVVIDPVYGATTDGQKWRFFKLKEDTLSIHHQEFSTDNLSIILGVFQFFIDDYSAVWKEK